MPDVIHLPHFQIVLVRDGDWYWYDADDVSIVAHELAHGWELALTARGNGVRHSIAAEGATLAEAESALVAAMGHAEDVLTAALMQASAECRHAS